MAQSGQQQLIPLGIKKVDHTVIADAQTKLRPALQSPMGKRIQAASKIADLSYDPRPDSSR
jgi:hypothetical protein